VSVKPETTQEAVMLESICSHARTGAAGSFYFRMTGLRAPFSLAKRINPIVNRVIVLDIEKY
jgi:hypothetical protein